jgi:Asp-tRNA(Asn)/Glu-tRNA(Gln) amidotransferase B subunit
MSEDKLEHACTPVDYDKIIDEVLTANLERWQQITSPEDNRISWFVGHIFVASKGKGNPNFIKEVLKQKKAMECVT